MNITISENNEFISIHVSSIINKSLTWEQLQAIKDSCFSKLDFIELFPKNKEIINKANVRHLIHIKNWNCPKLCDLKQESIITHKKI